jgi:nucleotide-binding universal stress UspA family protein
MPDSSNTADDKASPTSVKDTGVQKISIPASAVTTKQSPDKDFTITKEDSTISLALPKYFRIMVPHDGSPNSDRALAHAVSLSKKYNAELVILHVLEDIEDARVTSLDVSTRDSGSKGDTSHTEGKDLKYTLEGQGIRIIEDKIRMCKENGVNQVSYKVQIGNPADEIIKISQEKDFDLIIMASRRITSRILGSTTRKVIDTVKKPTLIIPYSSSEAQKS